MPKNTGSMPAKIPPRDHSDIFYDEGRIINPKANTEGKEKVVDGKQDIVHDSLKCYNGSAQLFQLKYSPHLREESGTGLASSSTSQYQELFSDPSPRFLPLHGVLTLCEIIVEIFSGGNNARHPEGGT